METTETQRKISAALKNHDNQAIDEAVADWLSGLSRDEELVERFEIESASFDIGSPAPRQVRHD